MDEPSSPEMQEDDEDVYCVDDMLGEDGELHQDDEDVYSVDGMLTEDEFLDGYLGRIGENILANLEAQPRRRRFFRRRYIPRPREIAHQDLYACYFAEPPIYTDEMFRRRYRMRRPLF
jgi:hypothetical protein